MSRDRYHMDMCNGPLFRKIIWFALPLIATGALQQLFSAADLIVVGRFATYQDMAAVGACLPVSGLIVNVLFGVSVGAGVLTANGIGARDKILTSRSIHTAMCVAGIGGVLLMLVGIVVTTPVLRMLDTPEDVLSKAAWYMYIFCIGLPTWSIYAYGSSLMRAMGDTKRPLYYLIFAGIVNVILNYILVAFFSLGVIGVALATMASFVISSILVTRALMNMPGALRLRKNLLKIDWAIFRRMLWIGLPAGIQGCFFSISNCVIQGAINTFGSTAMAGSAAALNIETIIYSASFSFNQTATSFAGQNMGAENYSRVARSAKYCIITSFLFVGLIGVVSTVFAPQLIAAYNSDPAVVEWGVQRGNTVFISYALCAVMDCITGSLRGMGKSLSPMLMTLFGVCAVRIAWVWWVFPLKHSMVLLMLSYPVSYIVNIILTGATLYWSLKKYMEHNKKEHYGEVRLS